MGIAQQQNDEYAKWRLPQVEESCREMRKELDAARKTNMTLEERQRAISVINDLRNKEVFFAHREMQGDYNQRAKYHEKRARLLDLAMMELREDDRNSVFCQWCGHRLNED